MRRRPPADFGLILRAVGALGIIVATYFAAAVVFLMNGIPQGLVLVGVVAVAAAQLLSSERNLLARLGIAQEAEADISDWGQFVLGRLPWFVPPLIPVLYWLLYDRLPNDLGEVWFAVMVTSVGSAMVAFVWLLLRKTGDRPRLTLRPLLGGPAVDAVNRVAQLAGATPPKVYLLNTSVPGAFALGISPRLGSIVVTAGLLDAGLTGDELLAVLAHELTHLLHHDSVVLTAVEALRGLPAFVGGLSLVVGGGCLVISLTVALGGLSVAVVGALGFTAMVFVVAIMAIAAWGGCHLVTLALTRYREYSADTGSAIITGDASGLAGALVKINQIIGKSAPPDLRQLSAANALMICDLDNPGPEGKAKTLLGKAHARWLLRFADPHPPIASRIARLQALIALQEVGPAET